MSEGRFNEFLLTVQKEKHTAANYGINKTFHNTSKYDLRLEIKCVYVILTPESKSSTGI